MVVVEYLYEDMRRLVGLPLDRVVDGLSELGAPSEYEEETKKIITELTPNRPDWYSMEGLARALRAYYRKTHPTYTTKKSDYRVMVEPSVGKTRPYTACAVVKGLELDDRKITDMVLLQEKLLGTLGRKVKKFGIGIYPLDGLAFPIRYTGMKPEDIRYVPLGQTNPMSADEILEKHKKGQQYGYLIKNESRYPVFLDARNRIMALIPIVNSAETGRVDVNAKDLFVEVTGRDLNACKAALNILVCTFADMGGSIYEVRVAYAGETILTPDLRPRKAGLELQKINKALGLDLNEKEVAALLKRMGYEYDGKHTLIPPYRADILDWVDIMEDVAVAYGYNNFKPTLPDFFYPGKRTEVGWNLDEIMRGMGFLEAKTFILTNKDCLAKAGYSGDVVEITNPSTEEYTVVRPDLLSSAMGILAINKMRGLPQKFYEMGIAHDGRKMKKKLVFCVADKKLGFSEVRGYLQVLAAEADFDFKLEEKERKFFEPGLSCAVFVGGKERGVFGKIAKTTLDGFGLEFEAYLCELEVG